VALDAGGAVDHRRVRDLPDLLEPGDLLVVNGNPLENLRLMNPYGTDLMSLNGQIVNNYSSSVKPNDPNVKSVHGGGIEWTIKDGIPYHVPTLMKEVKDMVTKARAERPRSTSQQ